MADNLLDKASILLTPTAYDNGSMLSIKPENGDGDFDFQRNSAATRVNAQGLVENVQILSSELVSNGNFSQIGTEEVLNGNFSQEGSELGDSGTISNNNGGVLTQILNTSYNATSDGTSTSTTRPRLNDFNVTAGKAYKLTITPSNQSGDIRFTVNNDGTNLVVYNDLSSTLEFYFVNGSNFRMFFDGTKTFNVDFEISLKEVGQNWNLGSGWSIGDGEAVADNAPSGQSVVSGSGALTIGKQYKVSYEILSITQGEFGFTDQGQLIARSNQVGVVTEYFTALGGGIRIRAVGTTSGSITNISVKEVGQDWTFGTGWSIEDDGGNLKAVADNAAFGVSLTQNIAFVDGQKYRVTYTISDYTSGAITMNLGSGVTGATRNSNGTYTEDYVHSGVNTLYVRPSTNNTSLTIDNISVKEITDDTNIPRINYEGFSYQDSLGEELVNFDTAVYQSGWQNNNDGSATFDINNGTGSEFIQSDVLEVGKTYQFYFKINFIGSGQMRLYCQTNLAFTVTQSGTYTDTFVADGSSIRFKRVAGDLFTIDNVSVKEYLGQEVVPDSGCGSWLLEPQSTNLVTYSEDFSNSSWIKIGSPTITPNYGTSPDGTQNSTRIQGSSSSYVSTNAMTGAMSGETRSLYVRATSGSGNIQLTSHNSNTNNVFAIDENWQRVQTNSLTSGGGSSWFYIDMRGASTDIYDIEVWAAQGEASSIATSYIPTNGATNTRLQDIANNSGNSSLINSTEGVLYCEVSRLNGSLSQSTISISKSGSEFLGFSFRADGNIWAIVFNGGYEVLMQFTPPNFYDTYKIALKYKSNDSAFFVNGVKVDSNTTSLLSLTELNNLSYSSFYGKTKALAVFPILTDAELQSLTTI